MDNKTKMMAGRKCRNTILSHAIQETKIQYQDNADVHKGSQKRLSTVLVDLQK